MKALVLLLLLPPMLALGIGAHALVAHLVKRAIWLVAPLARGEPEVCAYERQVYHTAEPAMLQVVVLAALAGALAWLALALGATVLGALAALTWLGALGLDLRRWERVSASVEHLWFQRGLGQKVYQVLLDNVRDVTVEEAEAGGFTLRRGRRNRVARLWVRMADKRVVALPKTDAEGGLAAIEAVANHVRLRLQMLRDRQALERSGDEAARAAAEAAAQPPGREREMLRELRRLRRKALDPEAPPAVRLPPDNQTR